MFRTIAIIGTTGSVMFGVAACGGSSSPAPAANTSVAPSASTGAAAAGGAGGSARAGGRGAFAGLAGELPAIKTCLTAAGISTAALPTAIPTGRPADAPRPSVNPTDRPTARPTGGFRSGVGGRRSGLFQILGNTADVTALKACGITVPTFRGGQGGFGRPGGAPGAPGGAPGDTAAPATT